jgi:hypothetical protein
MVIPMVAVISPEVAGLVESRDEQASRDRPVMMKKITKPSNLIFIYNKSSSLTYRLAKIETPRNIPLNKKRTVFRR